MAKDTTTERRPADVDDGPTTRKSLDAEVKDSSIDPKLGEDPGLLPLTEDPRERRLKRNTM
jgi:hypothetical protein